MPPSRDFRLLWSASVISQLGDWSARLAIALLVFAQTGRASLVGAAATMFVLPWLGPGQLLASFGDRMDRRRLLVGCDTLRAAVFVLIAAVDLPVGPLFVAIAVAALVDPVFEANRSALIVEVVPHDDYADAIQLSHVADQSAQLGGFALGGVLVALLEPEGTLAANAATFLLSALLISRVRARSSHHDRAVRPSLATAVAFVRSDAIAGIGTAATMIAVFCVAAVETQVAVYGEVVAGLGSAGIGLLAAAVPVGTIIVVGAVSVKGEDLAVLRRGVLAGLVVSALAGVSLAAEPRSPYTFPGFVLVGMALAVAAPANVVVGRRIPGESRAGTFAMLQAAIFVALSTGAAVGGIVSESITPGASAATAMWLLTVGSAVAMIALRTVAERRLGVTAASDHGE
ncbi:MAG: MFS transporter [Acidimicrobiales bacterium]